MAKERRDVAVQLGIYVALGWEFKVRQYEQFELCYILIKNKIKKKP